jgi:glyoxylase-like metal-dependent hydrolase (beta-lactamase superfamily II)/ferredoxin
MADPARRVPENPLGRFFVDASCIDCDQCRQVAPALFEASTDHSYVSRQPATPEEELRAGMALLTCPVGAIGDEAKADLAPAAAALPELIEGEVYSCGYASERSFGASSYLIRRPDGNVLVDSPRFTGGLARRLEELGGVRWMFLTHGDDVADHAKFRERFGCERIMHVADATFAPERPIDGLDSIRLAPDLLAIPVPGHTEGSTALLYRDRFLFTGDHFWWDPDRERLAASRTYCWYSWEDQLDSLRRLLGYSFEWVLPGHGHRIRLPADRMRASVDEMMRSFRQHPLR